MDCHHCSRPHSMQKGFKLENVSRPRLDRSQALPAFNLDNHDLEGLLSLLYLYVRISVCCPHIATAIFFSFEPMSFKVKRKAFQSKVQGEEFLCITSSTLGISQSLRKNAEDEISHRGFVDFENHQAHLSPRSASSHTFHICLLWYHPFLIHLRTSLQ
jgi:hypothetical protein